MSLPFYITKLDTPAEAVLGYEWMVRYNPMFLNRATMPIVATFHTLPAPYIAIFVPSTLPTLPVALPVALPTLPSETFSEKTCITSCYRDVKCAVIILSISTCHAECFL